MSALEAVIARYGSYVFAVCRNRSRGMLSAQDCEEITADIFFALWEQADRVDRLRPWLGSVARNKTVDRLRQRSIELPLEENLTLCAGVQVDPLSERGEDYLQEGVLTFRIYNDGHSCIPLTRSAGKTGDGVRYVLVVSGKTAAAGDTLLFAFDGLTPGAPACVIGETTVAGVLTGEKHVSLDPSVYDDVGDAYTSVFVTPLTLTVRNDGITDAGPECSVYNSKVFDENGSSIRSADGDYHPWLPMAAVTVTRKDGTSFPLPAEGPTGTPFGEYGAVLSGYSKASYTWTFTRPVALEELDSITVDGKEYPLGAGVP